MKSQGTAPELEGRRRLAVQWILEGGKQTDCRGVPGGASLTVIRWVTAYRRGGDDAIKAKPTAVVAFLGACCGTCGER